MNMGNKHYSIIMSKTPIILKLKIGVELRKIIK
jgi:hypothetical protein